MTGKRRAARALKFLLELPEHERYTLISIWRDSMRFPGDDKDRPRHERYMLIGLNGKWQVILLDMLALPFKDLRADADYRLLPQCERNA